jgi:hypothetical protein
MPAAISSTTTVLLFITASLAAFDERSFAVSTRIPGGTIAIGRIGFSIGYATSRGVSALRFAAMP